MKVAKRFPEVKFEHATGYKRDKNVSTYAARFYEGRTISGLIAGKMTKSNIIGYVASFPIPEVVRGINAFTLALHEVNPKAVVKVVWVNTWYDPGKESDAAKALIDQGADVILQHTDSPAPIQIAQKRGVWAVGQASDMTRFGSKAHLTAIVDVWDDYYVARTKAVLDGTWKSEDTWTGLKEGMLEMAPYNPGIPADVIALAKQAEADIKSGKRHPFQGPVHNQEASWSCRRAGLSATRRSCRWIGTSRASRANFPSSREIQRQPRHARGPRFPASGKCAMVRPPRPRRRGGRPGARGECDFPAFFCRHPRTSPPRRRSSRTG